MIEQNFLNFAVVDFLTTFLRYVAVSIIPFVLINKYFTLYFADYKIISPYKPKVKTEFTYSVLNFLFYCFADFFLLVLMKEWRVSKMYTDFGSFGYAYEALTVVIMFVAQDLSFYLIHRLLHKPWLFKKIHYVHHISKNPTALGSYSFHPIEAISMSFFFIILVMIIPINLKTAGVYFLFSHIYNSYGHSGYDFKFKKDGFFDKWISHSTRHHMHHKNNRGNFGLYTTVWDRLFKTGQ